MKLEEKIDIVKDILRDEKVAIGFSGGADSTLIAYLSSKVSADTLAITIDNHLLPTGFIEHTENVAKSFGIKHEVIDLDFWQDEDFLANTPSRCYSCRHWMYTNIERVAHENEFDFICDGNNISDLVIDRPGILVTYKKGFKTPFIEAKLTSKEIHEYLNKNNIPYSRSTTCLATRIPTNTPTTTEKIDKIRRSEDFIYEHTNCEIVKVRDLGKFGICEVDNIDELITKPKFNEINDGLKSIGFRKVALNLSPIDDDEYIAIDYNEGSFEYQLPFSINIENSKKILNDEIKFSNKNKIKIPNITIYENGLIKGNNFKNYDDALYAFMDTLPKLRRNI